MEILMITWMGQPHAVPDPRTDLLCSIRKVPGNCISKLAKIEFGGHEHGCFILAISRGAFQQFNNRVGIGKKGCQVLVFEFVTEGLTVNCPALQ